MAISGDIRTWEFDNSSPEGDWKVPTVCWASNIRRRASCEGSFSSYARALRFGDGQIYFYFRLYVESARVTKRKRYPRGSRQRKSGFREVKNGREKAVLKFSIWRPRWRPTCKYYDISVHTGPRATGKTSPGFPGPGLSDTRLNLRSIFGTLCRVFYYLFRKPLRVPCQPWKPRRCRSRTSWDNLILNKTIWRPRWRPLKLTSVPVVRNWPCLVSTDRAFYF